MQVEYTVSRVEVSAHAYIIVYRVSHTCSICSDQDIHSFIKIPK